EKMPPLALQPSLASAPAKVPVRPVARARALAPDPRVAALGAENGGGSTSASSSRAAAAPASWPSNVDGALSLAAAVAALGIGGARLVGRNSKRRSLAVARQAQNTNRKVVMPPSPAFMKQRLIIDVTPSKPPSTPKPVEEPTINLHPATLVLEQALASDSL
ncbi:unnamed protein product, partial [Polarella glacialis]